MNEHILPFPNHLLPATAKEVSGESQELDGETEAWRKGLVCSSHCLVQAVFQVCSVWMALFQVALTHLHRSGVTGHRLYRTEGGVWWGGAPMLHSFGSGVCIRPLHDFTTASLCTEHQVRLCLVCAWGVTCCSPGDHQGRPWRRK